MHISIIDITSKKVRGNNVDFSAIEITSKKVRRKNAQFSIREITLIKVLGNYEDFSTIEITSKKNVEITWISRPAKLRRKKYVEATWKFVQICSLTYQRNIHVESKSIRRAVPVGQSLKVKVL